MHTMDPRSTEALPKISYVPQQLPLGYCLDKSTLVISHLLAVRIHLVSARAILVWYLSLLFPLVYDTYFFGLFYYLS